MAENGAAVASIKVCADLLDQRWVIHGLSVALTICTVLVFLVRVALDELSLVWMIFVVIVIVLGVVETILAVRVGFDAALLRRLAVKDACSTMDLELLDSALSRLKLLPTAKAGRALDARLQGCLGLFRRQALSCAMQFFVLLSGSAWLAFSV